MFVRKILVAVMATGLSLSLASPSSADVSTQASTQHTGTVAASTDGLEGNNGTLATTRHVAGSCSYVGVTTTDGRIVFAFGGEVVARSATVTASTDPASVGASVPQAVQVNCRFISPTQTGVPGSEPTHEQTASTALAGAVVAAGATTPSLQLRPVFVCVSGFGVFGPTPSTPNPRFLPEACTANAVNLP